MDVEPTLAQGEASHKAGDLARAEQIYRAVLRAYPDDARARSLLAAVCLATGRVEEAVASLRESLRIRPAHATTWNMLGIALARQGRTTEAEACFRRALETDPAHAEAARNLERARQAMTPRGEASSFASDYRQALSLCGAGKYADAEPWLRRAVAKSPGSADAINDLGKVLGLLNRPDEALGCFDRAIALERDHARGHLNRAAVLVDLGRTTEAEAAAREAVRLEPGNPAAWNNLGLILGQLGRLSDAEEAMNDGLRQAPDHPELHANLGNVLVLQGRADEAQPHYARALEWKPDFASAHSNWLLSRHYLDGVSPASLAEDHRAWEERHARRLLRSSGPPPRDRTDPDRPMRLGFVSPDFRRHPVGYLMIRTIEALRPLDCRVVCYDTNAAVDEMTQRFAAAADVWRPSRGLSDDDLAELIHADEIDFLFDMSGHAAMNRLPVFARKPAPIQLTWLGYDGTTGLSAMDYLVADPHMVRPGTEPHYRETVLRLPDCYVCYDPPAAAPEVGPLPAAQAGHVTFGCFNNPAKIGRPVVAAWSSILSRVPSSRLLLKYKGLQDDRVARRFRELFAAQGVDPARVELDGWSTNAGMLASYGHVDIALDPFPFSGCLTTCEALWMGVPVVTRPVDAFAGRHSLSFLRNVGLESTIAEDLEHYAEIAARLAGDLGRLAEIRASMRPRMAASPLCDGPRLAGHLLPMLRRCRRSPGGTGPTEAITKAPESA